MTAKKVTEAPKKAAVETKAVEPEKATVKAVEPEKAAAAKEEAAKAVQAPAKKTAAPKKAAAKTATKTTKTVKAEKEAVSQNVYIQFAGKEIRMEDVTEQAKKAWVAEGHRASSLKSLDVYVKPEDSAAYYVVNGKAAGKIDL